MLYAFSFFGICHITYGAIIRLSTFCKVHSQIQLISCCEGFPSHLKERFLHFNNRIISLFGTDCMNQFVYFSYIILLVYQIVSYTAAHLSFLSTLCKYIKPATPVDYCQKVDKSVKKRFSHQEVGKSSEKRGFYISFPKKMFTLHYAILCTTIKLSGSSSHYTVYMLYIL